MKLSVITVCYNCADQIKVTLESLKSQTFKDFEYIVIDGASQDSTVDVIKQYSSTIENMRIYSEPDEGIYDAMNKGISKAKGDYIYFLNAGDQLFSPSVLAGVSKYLETGLDVFYGSNMRNGRVDKYPRKLTSFYLVYLEKMICHQAIFARRSTFLNNTFDTQFKICADRVWLINALKMKCSYEYMKDIIVAEYDVSGVSSQYSKVAADSLRIAARFGGRSACAFVRVKREIGKILGHNRN